MNFGFGVNEFKVLSFRSFATALLILTAGLPLAIAKDISTSTSVSDCAASLSEAQQSKRELLNIKRLNFATYNVENLFYYVGKTIEVAPGKFERVTDPLNKSVRAMRGVATTIQDLDLDVAVLVEVESEDSVKRFVRDFLGDLYDVHLIQGNDKRGINICFITKKDLPFEYELSTHKNDTWIDPADPAAGPVPLFSRDVPVLKIFAKDPLNNRLHLMSIAGVHNKSKRNRPGDPMGRLTRGAQAAREVEIWKQLTAEMGAQPRVIMAGDFNGMLGRDPELDVLNQLTAIEALDANALNQRFEHSITHTFHPPKGPVSPSEIDYIFISSGLQSSINRSYVYRYRRDDTGVEWPLPRTHWQRSLNPSDHFPKFMQIRFQDIVQSAIGVLAAANP